MRATRSDDTVLDGAFVPDRYIARVVPAGFAGADLFVLGIFAWAEPTFSSVYLAIARRAMDLAVAGLEKRTSIALGGQTLAHHPMLQHAVAEMSLELDGAIPHVEKTADDWSNGVDHGGLWPAKLVATKYHASKRPSASSTWRWRCRAGPACSVRTSSSGSTATCAAEGSTPRTPRSCTRSSARRRSACSPNRSAGSHRHCARVPGRTWPCGRSVRETSGSVRAVQNLSRRAGVTNTAATFGRHDAVVLVPVVVGAAGGEKMRATRAEDLRREAGDRIVGAEQPGRALDRNPLPPGLCDERGPRASTQVLQLARTSRGDEADDGDMQYGVIDDAGIDHRGLNRRVVAHRCDDAKAAVGTTDPREVAEVAHGPRSVDAPGLRRVVEEPALSWCETGRLEPLSWCRKNDSG